MGKVKTRTSSILELAGEASKVEEKFTGVKVETDEVSGKETPSSNETPGDQEVHDSTGGGGTQQAGSETAGAAVAPVVVTRDLKSGAGVDYAKKNQAYEGERTTNVGLYVPVKEKLEVVLTITKSKGTIQDLANNIITEWLEAHQDELNKLFKKMRF